MKIYKRIHDAKKEIGKISKNNTNPFFNSQYFEINTLLEQIEPILEKNGLMVLQPIIENTVNTQIIHVESGETITSSMELPNLTDPQKLGSAITYYRRYTLQSLLSLQAEDDDGNKAGQVKNVKQSTNNNSNLPWLNEKDMGKIVAQAKVKGLSAIDLRAYYKISKANFELLKSKL